MSVSDFALRTVTFEQDVCEYWIGEGTPGAVASILGKLDASSHFVVCDEYVAELFGATYRDALSEFGSTTLLVHAIGEPTKRLATVESLGEQALRAGIDRSSVVVALGGGLTGNIAGMTAALLFRGVRLAHVPTTFLSMVDSVFSLKQAVNGRYGKNVFGTFHVPSTSVLNVCHVASLDEREISSAMCEVIKNALSVQPEFIPRLRELLATERPFQLSLLKELLEFALTSKARVLASDRCERKTALVCEYGHTVGHAIEHVERVPHGIAIGIGMLVAAEIGLARGYISNAVHALHYELLRANGYVFEALSSVDVDRVLATVAFDNKRGYLSLREDETAMVLLGDLGEPRCSPVGLPVVPVAMEELRCGIEVAAQRILSGEVAALIDTHLEDVVEVLKMRAHDG